MVTFRCSNFSTACVLTHVSLGMILFPLGQPIFEKLGSAGISMFYVSCIISQLVYSGGGSVFKGGVGSEMVRSNFPSMFSLSMLIHSRLKLFRSFTKCES